MAKVAREAKARVVARATAKVKGDPLKQRLVSRTQCRLCGAEGSDWEEDCPQADVDMPQAKRRVTFSRPHVGVSVSQAWCVWKRRRSRRLQKVLKLDLKMWNSHEIQESTMTTPEGHAILDCGAALDCIGEVQQLLAQLRPSPRLEKHVARQLWTRYRVSSLEAMVIWWKRHLL